jgi:hypothetical protein
VVVVAAAAVVVAAAVAVVNFCDRNESLHHVDIATVLYTSVNFFVH